MRTVKENRVEAKECLELASQRTTFLVKTSLMELAHDYNRAAREAERQENALDTRNSHVSAR